MPIAFIMDTLFYFAEVFSYCSKEARNLVDRLVEQWSGHVTFDNNSVTRRGNFERDDVRRNVNELLFNVARQLRVDRPWQPQLNCRLARAVGHSMLPCYPKDHATEILRRD